MEAKLVLQNAITTLNGMHVLGMDAEKMESVKRNIRAVIIAIENAERTEQDAERGDGA